MITQDHKTSSDLIRDAFEHLRELVKLELHPGQVTYVEEDRFVIPDYGDASEEYW